MKITSRRNRLHLTLILATFLLAMQTFLFWHQHHDQLLADEHCQICLLAQHYTPGPVSQPAPVLLLLTHFEIHVPTNHESATPTYFLFNYSRAPPASFT